MTQYTRQLTKDDAAEVWRIRQEIIGGFGAFESLARIFPTNEVVASYLEEKAAAESDRYIFGIFRGSLLLAIGVCAYDPKTKRSEVGGCISVNERGKGIACEMMAHLLHKYPKATFVAHVDSSNRRALAAAQKVGFCLRSQVGSEMELVLAA